MINLSENNMWGIVMHFLKALSKVSDGRYLLLRDANKPILKLFQIPQSAELGDDDEEEAEDETPNADQRAETTVPAAEEEDSRASQSLVEKKYI